MNRKLDGGPAFPVTNEESYLGMSLRDYFAAKAMQGMMSRSFCWRQEDYVNYANMSYRMADAMLAERQK